MSYTEQRQAEEDRARPEHYRKHRMECIREMALMFGMEAVITFCKLNAWKYRYRRKDNDDDRKADEYIAIMENILNGSFWGMYEDLWKEKTIKAWRDDVLRGQCMET